MPRPGAANRLELLLLRPGGCAVGIQPGHDAWVVGDEPWVTVDFSQAMADYAKPS